LAYDLEVRVNGDAIASRLNQPTTSGWTTVEFDLEAAEAVLIDDFANIEFAIRPRPLGGTQLRVTWVEFEVPGSTPVVMTPAGGVAMPIGSGGVQLLRPNATIASSGWGSVGAIQRHAAIDEVTPDDDTTYAFTNTDLAWLHCGFSSGSDPDTDEGFKIRLRLMQTSGA